MTLVTPFVEMSLSNPPRTQARRSPLGEVTRRVNNASHIAPTLPHKESFSLPLRESLTANGLHRACESQDSPGLQQKGFSARDSYGLPGSSGSNAANPRLSAISKDCPIPNSNRNSQISTTSTNGSDGRRRKTHIGPWHLGKTLGKGATARVRMARHAVTGQPAAIKIVQKKNAQLSQAGSLAALDQLDAAMNNTGEGPKRMPYGIEREVAIMKLIEHPHIMKLYDIWENRTEIYLVLEFVDNGELFEHISRHGWLSEDEALKYFRQLLSAVGYCHSFNICHRDLKPENILLTKNLEIKVADFGMAALHQTPEHRLQTPCGSPHYAAPEVIKGTFYRGDKADIWSMGVILFASLVGYLPFDHEDLPGLLEVIKKGRFKMPSQISQEAADLIHRMLQLNPRDRLSISQMWRHPLLRKYDYLDNYGGGLNPRSPVVWNSEVPLLRRSDIDRELLRHLRSMWHTFEEQQIIKLLLSDECIVYKKLRSLLTQERPNEQKVFYDLLLRHRTAQLENYVPDMGHSTSDYHHARPLAQVKKLSTRQFSQPSQKGYGRAISRFTVVSNISRGRHSSKNSGYADTEAADTVQSYDPFRASRPQNLLGTTEAARTNVVVHHGRSALQDMKATSRSSCNSSSTSRVNRSRQQHLAPPRGFASRSSLASSTKSRDSNHGPRLALLHKRGVSFSHIRKISGTSQNRGGAVEANQNSRTVDQSIKAENVTIDGSNFHNSNLSLSSPAQYIRSRKATASSSQPLLSLPKRDRVSRLWNEDVRQLSSSLAKTCDEAFNRTSVVSTVHTKMSGLEDSQDVLYDSPISSFEQADIRYLGSAVAPLQVQNAVTCSLGDRNALDSRPLPPPPTRSDSVNIELAEARKKVQLRKLSGADSPEYIDRMVSHIDQLMQPTPLKPKGDRRALSVPINSRVHDTGRALPSINESNREGTFSDRSSDYENFVLLERVKVAESGRHTSAPEPRLLKKSLHHDLDDRTSRQDARTGQSIGVIQPYSPSPAKPPAPLNIRKKAWQGPPSMSGANRGIGSRERPPKFDLRQQYSASSTVVTSPQLSSVDEIRPLYDPFADESAIGTVKKKPNWFKRTSKSGEDDNICSIKGSTAGSMIQATNNEDLITSNKKKGFGFGRIFNRRSVKKEGGMSIRGFEIQDDSASFAESIEEEQRQSHVGRVTNFENPRTRLIEPQQNWLARLFHVKPATRFICFSVSKRRARQEIASLLREWRKYGARDIVVDKERNVVFGRVGPRNYFQMKEVAFASEILAVIEHGKKSPLSIARFTQEKGAASSFYKVVETLETILKSRGMLVTDERKKRMIIKTLNTA